MAQMKTTVDLPDDLLVEAKKQAIERRTTLRALIEQSLRRELCDPGDPTSKRRIEWVTSEGGLPPGMDVSDRESIYGFLLKES